MRRLRSVILAKEDAEALNNLGKRLKNSIDIFQVGCYIILQTNGKFLIRNVVCFAYEFAGK